MYRLRQIQVFFPTNSAPKDAENLQFWTENLHTALKA